ncbi:MAG: hypothetical protein A2W91_05805 [Bacteroidetes bacterium GWF2_38_335]|nr:MAG: hypothetical protein A2W91_05805 [Bacteroidetes bacterium GWF2_38_335]OFY81639.1 MAG: hypothetical protein A2281_11600 [Bacteroidetes bacterium RIFOXYA12_FULL_38_20]HBS88940.1 alanine dehydrogenase [Bacteroidales bacterium]
MKAGVLRETKTPPDRRVCVSPHQAVELTKRFPNVDLVIQSSENRCFKDHEYTDLGLKVVEDVSDCEVLLGVKEVYKPALLENKKYLFFSHTAKKQPHNRELLQKMVKMNIQMIDHEYITDHNGIRLVAFGRWAGIVGAYNGLIAIGRRFGLYSLKRAIECHDMAEMLQEVKKVKLPKNYKIIVTGKGRVGKGAFETLAPLNLKQVNAADFLNKTFDEPVVCWIDADEYTKRKDGQPFEFPHFFKHPELYEENFKPFTKAADMYIACHFWDPKSPVFIKREDYHDDDFKIRIISDVSCDIKDPIASTIKASTIADPFFGYNPHTDLEGPAFDDDHVTVMSVDNLPGELPRDASVDFSKALLDKVFPALFGEDTDGVVERASICKEGSLTPKFSYLQGYLEGKE